MMKMWRRLSGTAGRCFALILKLLLLVEVAEEVVVEEELLLLLASLLGLKKGSGSWLSTVTT